MIARAAVLASIAALLVLVATLNYNVRQSHSGPKSLAELQREWREVRRMWND